ncbi:hypothetical protein ACP4OV_010900 [Aristida adscensionis]
MLSLFDDAGQVLPSSQGHRRCLERREHLRPAGPRRPRRLPPRRLHPPQRAAGRVVAVVSLPPLHPAAAGALPHDADAVVTRLAGRSRRRQRRGYVALETYVVAAGGGGRRSRERRVVFFNHELVAALSGSVDDMAGALRTPGSAGRWLWERLADEIGLGLFLHVCKVNGVPVEPGFAAIPGAFKALILGRLGASRDLAMAECASKELRDLATEQDAVLWKDQHERLEHYLVCRRCSYSRDDADEENISWKQRYMRANKCTPRCFDSHHLLRCLRLN